MIRKYLLANINASIYLRKFFYQEKDFLHFKRFIEEEQRGRIGRVFGELVNQP